MTFLGDAGGVYGSLIILGKVMHTIVSGNEMSAHMLEKYFRVVENPGNESAVSNNKKSSKKQMQFMY